MGGMLGGGTTISTSEPRVGAMRIQQSSYGSVLPIVFGCQRITPNLLGYYDFTPVAHTSSQASEGKGGGVTQSNTTYTYQTAVMMAICHGQIAGIGAAWKGKSKYTNLADAGGMTLFDGSMSQSAWSYLTSKHPAEAINYPGVAYVAHGSYQLGSSPSLDNHSFEVLGAHQFGGGIVDCDPAVVLTELLTNQQFGAGFPALMLGDLTDLSNYCVSAGLFISPVLAEQKAAHEWITAIADVIGIVPVTADGIIQFVPLSDSAQFGNGRTWTPDLTPAYDLTDDDFLDHASPVRVLPKPKTDAFNSVSIEFLDRANDYNVSVVTAHDQGDIELYGLRKAQTVTAHFICTAAIAQQCAQMLLQRYLYVRNEYEFRLAWPYIRLMPMSIVTLTDDGLGLDRFPVRIRQITEAADGELTIIAEEMPIGTASPAMYSPQSGSGFASNHNIAPGAVNAPLIFEPPLSLTGGANQLWAAVSGGVDWGGCNVWASLDGSTYQRVGQILGRARYGTLNAFVAAPSANPDIINSIVVNLNSDEQMMPASQTEVDAFATLCWVDGEMLAYRDASLVTARRYSLSYLNRGLYGTTAVSHASGAQFARIDNAIFKFQAQTATVGSIIHLKFTSFNAYGQAEESLANVTAYTHTVNGGLPSGPANLALQTAFVGLSFTAQWSAEPGATGYDVELWSGGVMKQTFTTTSTQLSYTLDQAITAGGPWRDWDVKVATLSAGPQSGYSQISISNPTPLAPTGITTSSTSSSITIGWNAVADVDLLDYQVHISTSSGFTPSGANLVYAGAALSTVITGLPSATNHYLRVCARDKWGSATLVYSAEILQATI